MFKNKIIQILIILLVIIGAIFAYFIIVDDSRYYKKLENKLIEMGTDFYSNFYYEQLKDNIDYFHETGIPVSLNSLKTYGLDISEFKNKKTGNPCDGNKTLAKVVFKENTKNYKDDFSIEPVLVCE